MRFVLIILVDILDDFYFRGFVLEGFDGFFISIFFRIFFLNFGAFDRTCGSLIGLTLLGLQLERVLGLLFLESRVKRARRRRVHD